MKAVVTVIGKDRTGIIARISGLLYEKNVNILDISQTIMQDMFCMIMLIESCEKNMDISALTDELNTAGAELGVSVHVQREELFESMHRI